MIWLVYWQFGYWFDNLIQWISMVTKLLNKFLGVRSNEWMKSTQRKHSVHLLVGCVLLGLLDQPFHEIFLCTYYSKRVLGYWRENKMYKITEACIATIQYMLLSGHHCILLDLTSACWINKTALSNVKVLSLIHPGYDTGIARMRTELSLPDIIVRKRGAAPSHSSPPHNPLPPPLSFRT